MVGAKLLLDTLGCRLTGRDNDAGVVNKYVQLVSKGSYIDSRPTNGLLRAQIQGNDLYPCGRMLLPDLGCHLFKSGSGSGGEYQKAGALRCEVENSC
jgi:hypothetical protein